MKYVYHEVFSSVKILNAITTVSVVNVFNKKTKQRRLGTWVGCDTSEAIDTGGTT